MKRLARRAAGPAAVLVLAFAPWGSRDPMAAITTPADQPPAPAPESPDGGSRKITFVYDAAWLHIPKNLAKLDFWIPIPWHGGPQTVTDLVFQSPAGAETGTDPAHGNLMFHGASGRRGGVGYNVQIKCVVERRAVRFDGFTHPPQAPAPEPGNLASYLKGSHLAPVNEAMKSRAASTAGKLKTEHEKARALYQWVVDNVKLDEGGHEWGREDTKQTLTTMKGDAFDVTELFVALLRASGIPARPIVGFQVPTRPKEGYLSRPHAWAEFWLAGFGWVPADPVLAIERPAEKEKWFGRLDENRLQMSTGSDVMLNPPQSGDPLDYLLYPYAQADGRPFGGSSYRFGYGPPPAPPEAPPSSPTP